MNEHDQRQPIHPTRFRQELILALINQGLVYIKDDVDALMRKAYPDTRPKGEQAALDEFNGHVIAEHRRCIACKITRTPDRCTNCDYPMCTFCKMGNAACGNCGSRPQPEATEPEPEPEPEPETQADFNQPMRCRSCNTVTTLTACEHGHPYCRVCRENGRACGACDPIEAAAPETKSRAREAVECQTCKIYKTPSRCPSCGVRMCTFCKMDNKACAQCGERPEPAESPEPSPPPPLPAPPLDTLGRRTDDPMP